MKRNKDLIREIADEIDTFDTMFASLVEILEEKGILTQEELENKVRKKTSKAGGLTNYRDIQFANRK
jgi:transcription initiation factor IIE alpha subunit